LVSANLWIQCGISGIKVLRKTIFNNGRKFKMEKCNVNYFVVGLFAFYILSVNLNAQDGTFSNHLKSFFKVQKEIVLEKQTINFEDNVRAITGKNIEKFLLKENLLRSQGKSPDEINRILRKSTLIGTGSISGTVYESDGITPVSEFLSIYVFDKYGMYIGYGFISSYAGGSYIVQNLPAGKYYVRTNSDHYFDEFYDNAATWQQATLVQVSEGQETQDINFSLDYYKGVISGSVVNPDGNPVSDCYISASELTNYGFNYAYTDSFGSYNLTHLKPGTYIISCYYEGEKNYTDQYYFDADNYENATPVILPSEDTVKNINFKLSTGGAISGRITKNNGLLFQPDYINLSLYTINGDYLIASGYIDSLGYFTFKKLNAGSYKLLAEYYNYSSNENYVDTWFRESYTKEGAEVIQVLAGDTVENINFTLKPGGSISGKVSATNFSYVGGNVIVFDKDMNYIAGYYTNTSENYLINGLVPGDYKVTANFQDYKIQWYNNKDDFETADWVTVNPNDTTENINFNLEPIVIIINPGAKIYGNISDPDGMPCSGNISLFDLNNNLVGSAYGFVGTYFWENIPPGSYKINAVNSSFPTEWYNKKNSFYTADTITLSIGQTKEIDFQFENFCSVAGFVTDELGNRIDGDKFAVFAAAFNAVTGDYIIDRSVTFLGGYKLKLRPNNYKVGLIPVYFNYQTDQDSLARTFYKSGASFNDAATLPINLFPLTELELEDIKLEKASGSISGIIFDSDNQPIDSLGYGLFAYDEDGLLAKSSVYSIDGLDNGNFKLTGLQPGKYYLLALATNGEDYTQIQWYDGVDFNGSFDALSLKMNIPSNINAIEVGTSEVSGVNFQFNTTTYLNSEKELITGFILNQNYPNPFNPSTTISWQSPVSGKQTIKVYDVLGKEVATLVDEYRNAGSYEVEFNAGNLASGVYLYKLQAGNFVQTKKMVLIK
jgi:hypothetical protein